MEERVHKDMETGLTYGRNRRGIMTREDSILYDDLSVNRLTS